MCYEHLISKPMNPSFALETEYLSSPLCQNTDFFLSLIFESCVGAKAVIGQLSYCWF